VSLVELQHLTHGVVRGHNAPSYAAMHNFTLKAICDSTHDVDEQSLAMDQKPTAKESNRYQ
jgi:hypothetical protein